MAIYMRLRHAAGHRSDPARVRPAPAATVELERCEREVEQDAAEIINEIRHRTQDSVARHARGPAEPGRDRRAQVGDPDLRGPDLRRPRLRDRRTRVDRRRLARHARRPAARRAAVRRVAVARGRPRRARIATCRSPASRCSPARRADRSIASTSPPSSRSIGFRARSTAITCSASNRGPTIATAGAIASASRRSRRGVTIRSRRSFLTSISGEGDDAGRRRDARDPIAAADQRSAAEDLDVDLQGTGQRQGARADRRGSRTARRPVARLHGRHGDREQAGPRRGAAGAN